VLSLRAPFFLSASIFMPTLRRRDEPTNNNNGTASIITTNKPNATLSITIIRSWRKHIADIRSLSRPA